MATIQIKSIGPIVDTGVIELRTINLFIGQQSTGKSTLLKILSHCRWIEKVLSVGRKLNGRSAKYFYTHHYRFVQELISFYRFDSNFFSSESEIIYRGDTYVIEFKGNHKSNAKIELINGATPYNVKLCFLPSERNLVSAIKGIESWYRQKELDLLFNFIFEWDDVRSSYSPTNAMPLVVTPQLEYFFDKNRGEQLRLVAQHKEFSPFYASSGVQSALPLEVMVNSLVQAVGSKANLSKNDLMDIVSSLLQDDADFNKTLTEGRLAKELLTYQGAIFFIEEIEQNLFPQAQADLLRHIVAEIKEANGKYDGRRSMVALTTHSPYILSALNVLMTASEAYSIDAEATTQIVDERFILPKDSISAYYLSTDGRAYGIIDSDIYMVDGTKLDGASSQVEDVLDKLNDIICQ